MIKKIIHNGQLLAIVIFHNYEKDGIEFFTPKELSQQLGYMKHPAGYEIQPHIHKLVIRQVQYTQETLLVKSGKIVVNLFTPERRLCQSEILVAGDVILLVAGGHGFEFLEESELIEIKQGPYLSFEVDKERF